MNFTNVAELNSELNSPVSVYACMYVVLARCNMAGGVFSSDQLAKHFTCFFNAN